jgi:hypothetical protein
VGAKAPIRWLVLGTLCLITVAFTFARSWRSTLPALPSHPTLATLPTAPEVPLPADFPKGLLVNVSGDTISDILAQLYGQTSLQFSVMGGNDKLTGIMQLKDVPLWEAVRQLQIQAGPGGAIQWHVGDGPAIQQVAPPFSSAGPFLIRANSIVHNADYGRADVESYYLSVLVISDSSARIVSMQHASNPSRALDDLGNSLVPTAPAPLETDMVAERGGGQHRVESVRILLQRPGAPASAGRTLKLLEGNLPVTIATRIDSLRLGFPTEARRRYGNIEATITCMPSRVPTVLETRVAFARPSGISDDEWNRTATIFASTRVRLVGGDGSQIGTQRGIELTTATGYRVTVNYDKPASTIVPQVLVEIPAEYESILIPYHFENLPLP